MDAARPPRAGEELPVEALAKHLGLPNLTVAQFPGGHSNLTYLLTADGEELVLRRPPFGSKVKTAHDMAREFRILSALHGVSPLVPRPYEFCADESVIGARFYTMERMRGLILRKELPRDLAVDARRLADAFVDAMVELHAIDWRAVGLEDFGKPDGYVERQVSGWAKRYTDAQTDDIPEMAQVSAWLAAHLPVSPPPAIVHNDFKFDNLVLDPDDPAHIIGILDWEMATIGDPLMDLGTALCYWTEAGDAPELLESRFGPTTAPGMPTRLEVARRYAEKSGRDLSALSFYYAFGLWKTAVVAQQIYARYKAGLTRDARFANMLPAMRALARQAAAQIT